MITAFLSHPYCQRHDMGPDHPESPLRLDAIRAQLMRSGVLQHAMQADAREATEEQLQRVHPEAHLARLEQASPQDGHASIDADTLMNSDSLQAARLAAGAVVKGVDQVFRGQADNVFCAVRPPGHHAEAQEAMGFCFYNNVAVGAAHARAVHGARRIAILDFDVHQCNGTIDIFKNDPEVMVCTSFQYPFYPWRYLDTPYPNVVHTPLPAGTESAGFRAAIERDWWPALEDFRPELILVSAGFDAHRDDPMAELCLADEDYHWITQGILDIARRHAEGRVVSVLEGGYDLAALGRSVEAHLRALLGLAYQP
ncbi:histone deacetylase family protein [Halomonas sp. DN3]|uniref:histone deacetylase family protein n=1 Tax=Halomonas sp. DN3 TaxID=2953657 RepID=UPI00209D4954|nr:histone deacetylase family protein [Halomonas sp. DN3]USZ51848.1 histone deacetylase family protein [Halomonas sp. DN3]